MAIEQIINYEKELEKRNEEAKELPIINKFKFFFSFC